MSAGRAIERIGARREGVWRKHMLVKNGSLRDTVLSSMTEDEWPAVKRRLEGLLRPRGAIESGVA